MITKIERAEMGELRDRLVQQLLDNPPMGENYKNRVDYQKGRKFVPDSIDYVQSAFSADDIDLLRVFDRHLSKHWAAYIVRAANALRATGVTECAGVITDLHLQATERVNEAIIAGSMRTSKHLSRLHPLETGLLKDKAIDLVVANLSSEEKVMYLIIEAGVVEPDQLAIRLREIEGMPLALIDGAL
jgi:hypothetical protein